jgi:hypothetical protein
LCDRGFHKQQAMVTEWLKTAVRRGCVSSFFEGEFPRYVWYLHEGAAYEARLVNRTRGHYKGYSLLRQEWPNGLSDYYGQS